MVKLSGCVDTSLNWSNLLGSGASRAFIITLVSGWFALPPAFGQQPAFPQLDFWAGGSVFDISGAGDGSAYAVGSFALANGAEAFSAIRIEPDGSLASHFRPNVLGAVFAVDALPAGGAVLGGNFTQVNGVNRQRLVRLAPNGQISPSWSASANNAVLVLHSVQSALYLGGRFTQVNGVSRTALARLNLETGALDLDFSPDIEGVVFDLTVDELGRIWVGGSFSSVNGEAAGNLAVLAADGSVVETFVVDSAVRGVSFDAMDKVYVCGGFSAIDGEQRRSAARLSALEAPALDPWAIETDGNLFRCLADQGGVWIGGDFSAVSGSLRSGLARVGRDGAVSADFVPSLDGVFVGNPGSAVRVLALETLMPDRLMVGGLFNFADKQPIAGLAALEPSSGELTLGFALEARAEIRSGLAKLADGSLLVGGTFRRVGDVIANNLIRIKPNGLPDPDWEISSNGPILVTETLGDGSVILGGFFSQLGSESRFSLARLENPTAGLIDEGWRPEVLGSVHSLHVDACVPDFLYVGGFFSSAGLPGQDDLVNFAKFDVSSSGSALNFNVSFDDQVNAIVQPDCETLLVAGLFNQAAGLPRRGMARVLTASQGMVDSSFNANLNGVGWSLLRDPQSGAVFIGGEFTQAFGQTRNRIAKWSGSLSSWNPGTDGVPVGLALDGLGGLYTVGTFTQFGGAPRARIAKVSKEAPAILDPDFNPGSNGPILWGAKKGGDQLFVSGDFSVVGGLSRRGLAIFNIDVLRPDLIFRDRFGQNGLRSGEAETLQAEDGCEASPLMAFGPLEFDRPFAMPACPAH